MDATHTREDTMDATTDTATATTPTPKVHVFEHAGLGRAPFRVVGHTVEKFQAHPGAPVKAGTSCDYCGTAIADTYWIKSADGKKFKVGSDCVFRTGDTRLRRQVNEVKRKARHASQDAKIDGVKERLADPVVREALAAKPHPVPYMAKSGKTLLDWADWMMGHAGRSGKVKVGKAIAGIA